MKGYCTWLCLSVVHLYVNMSPSKCCNIHKIILSENHGQLSGHNYYPCISHQSEMVCVRAYVFACVCMCVCVCMYMCFHSVLVMYFLHSKWV